MLLIGLQKSKKRKKVQVSNLWKILTFIWENKDLIWSVIQEIMDLFKDDENVKAKACKACHTPGQSVLAQLGQEANQYARRSKR